MDRVVRGRIVGVQGGVEPRPPGPGNRTGRAANRTAVQFVVGDVDHPGRRDLGAQVPRRKRRDAEVSDAAVHEGGELLAGERHRREERAGELSLEMRPVALLRCGKRAEEQRRVTGVDHAGRDRPGRLHHVGSVVRAGRKLRPGRRAIVLDGETACLRVVHERDELPGHRFGVLPAGAPFDRAAVERDRTGDRLTAENEEAELGVLGPPLRRDRLPSAGQQRRVHPEAQGKRAGRVEGRRVVDLDVGTEVEVLRREVDRPGREPCRRLVAVARAGGVGVAVQQAHQRDLGGLRAAQHQLDRPAGHRGEVLRVALQRLEARDRGGGIHLLQVSHDAARRRGSPMGGRGHRRSPCLVSNARPEAARADGVRPRSRRCGGPAGQ